VTKLLLSLHVLAAIVAIGPVTVAASMFPAAIRRAAASPGGTHPAVPAILHRICRVYAGLGLLVPVFGLATASSLGVLTDAWLIISMILTAVAGVILAFAILPAQAKALAEQSAQQATLTEQNAQPAALMENGGYPASPAEHGDQAARPTRQSGRTATLAGPAARAAARLGMVTGLFNLLWAAVVVLMVVRPGSTTGV
jgi:hypothetical protein